MSGNRFFSLLLRSRSNRILYMSEYLFRGLVKTILDPLVDDSKTAIGQVRHNVGIISSVCFLFEHEVLNNTHDRRDQSSPVEQREQIPVIVNEPEQQAVFIPCHLFRVKILIGLPFIVEFVFQEIFFPRRSY